VGGRSRAAAQLLSGEGFKEVYNMKGGIKAWQGLEAVGPAEMGMALLSGEETAEEIISLAYGMEAGLGELYLTLAESTGDEDLLNLLLKLADIEESHKNKLFDVYLTLAPGAGDQETFESGVESELMEGGFTTKEFLEQNRESMRTVPDVLSMAMMLETQALDLYLKFSHKMRDDKGKEILYQLADEEKAHLTALGHLMEERT
jgi:rubrerythrin